MREGVFPEAPVDPDMSPGLHSNALFGCGGGCAMILKYSVGAALLLAAIIVALRVLPEPDRRKESAEVAARVLKAVQAQDFEAFVALGDKGVRKMRAEDFQSLAERHASRLRLGHELRPLGERWRGAVLVSRWKLIFKDGGPDAVLTLGVRDGRVASFVIF